MALLLGFTTSTFLGEFGFMHCLSALRGPLTCDRHQSGSLKSSLTQRCKGVTYLIVAYLVAISLCVRVLGGLSKSVGVSHHGRQDSGLIVSVLLLIYRVSVDRPTFVGQNVKTEC